MGVSFLIIATCLVFGAIAAILSMRPEFFSTIGDSIRDVEKIKKFSPKSTLFIVGPTQNHAACRMQRRLLKPAIPALICKDITIVEVYGNDTPRKNGELVDWLDPSLLRHALDVDDGFFVVYVNDDGKTQFRSEAPMVTTDILKRAGLDFKASRGKGKKRSSVLKKLRAA